MNGRGFRCAHCGLRIKTKVREGGVRMPLTHTTVGSRGRHKNRAYHNGLRRGETSCPGWSQPAIPISESERGPLRHRPVTHAIVGDQFWAKLQEASGKTMSQTYAEFAREQDEIQRATKEAISDGIMAGMRQLRHAILRAGGFSDISTDRVEHPIVGWDATDPVVPREATGLSMEFGGEYPVLHVSMPCEAFTSSARREGKTLRAEEWVLRLRAAGLTVEERAGGFIVHLPATGGEISGATLMSMFAPKVRAEELTAIVPPPRQQDYLQHDPTKRRNGIRAWSKNARGRGR